MFKKSYIRIPFCIKIVRKLTFLCVFSTFFFSFFVKKKKLKMVQKWEITHRKKSKSDNGCDDDVVMYVR